MPSRRDVQGEDERRRARRRRSVAMGFALASLVALLYAVTIVKLGG